jgi:small RNA 2'-O-methyltransferase
MLVGLAALRNNAGNFLDSSLVASPLHRARLNVVVNEMLSSGVRRVADLGCGHGELLEWLRGHDQFTYLFGVDVDARALARARTRLGIDLLRPDGRLHVSLGSFENVDWDIPEVDAAVMLETIEHVDPGRLPRVEQVVFGRLNPSLVLITTPNKEYNPLHGLSERQRRHPGHRFEWTRAQFRSWCKGVAERRGYALQFSDIGPADPVRGSSTQMARFDKAA